MQLTALAISTLHLFFEIREIFSLDVSFLHLESISNQGKYMREAISIPVFLTSELSLLVSREVVPKILMGKPSFYEDQLDMDRFKNLSSICETFNQGN